MIVAYEPAPLPATGWYGYLGRGQTTSSTSEEDKIYEVVEGVRVEKIMAMRERMIGLELFKALLRQLGDQNIGRPLYEIPFLMPSAGNRRIPDASFLTFETWGREKRLPEGDEFPVAPDLAVEVISPSEKTWASFAKLEEYFAEGVKQVWLVLPNVERIYCYTSPTAVRILSRGDDLTAEPLIPGFRLPVADLFGPIEEPSAEPNV